LVGVIAGVDAFDLAAVARPVKADEDMGDAGEAQAVEQHLLVPRVQCHFGSVTLGLLGQDARQVGRDLGRGRSAAGKMNGHVRISRRGLMGDEPAAALSFPGGLPLPAPFSTSPLPDPSVRRRFPRKGEALARLTARDRFPGR
jgi:hypothetical protein